MRTTLDISDPLLNQLKRIGRREGKSLGELVSELLAGVLKGAEEEQEREPFRWATRSLGRPRVDLGDKEGVYALLDRESGLRAAEPRRPSRKR